MAASMICTSASGMFRAALKTLTSSVQRCVLSQTSVPPTRRCLSSAHTQYSQYSPNLRQSWTHNLLAVSSPFKNTTRTVVRYSIRKGKPKSSKAVVGRFYRLYWGSWIRPRSGRQKRLWRKNKTQKYNLRQHVFCNKQQNKLLDKMVTSFWKRPHHYVDDPYAPYNKRTNLIDFHEKPRFFP